jgi:flagellar hook protein FlgE
MALTNSLQTGLTGLDANSQKLSVVGNNIANSNTTGYKRSRITFETAITQTMRRATGPTAELGGTNPAEVGLGANTAAITRQFNGGSLNATGVNTDMAIQGNGMFVIENGDQQRYTRAGNFDLDSENNLVTQNGWRVMGYGVDDNFNVQNGGNPEALNIPIGNLTVAERTSTATFGGNLNTSGAVASQGSVNESQTLYSDAAATTQATSGTALTSVYDASSGSPLFSNGDVITVDGVSKGGTELGARTFEVNGTNTTGSDDNGTTLGQFNNFLADAVGVDTSLGGNIQVNSGKIELTSNEGTANGVTLESADVVVNAASSPTSPFQFNKTQDADGESVRTRFAAFDSLGNELNVDVSMVLENKSNSGTTWRYFAQSEDNQAVTRELGTGTLEFDNNGKLITSTNPTISIDRSGTGAQTPQQITLDVQGENDRDGLSALTDTESSLSMTSQDGSATGTLQDFSVGSDGVIQGQFSNNLRRSLGQVAVASFTNPQGLEDAGNNRFAETRNSGAAQIGEPTIGGRGRIVGSALEGSNVDISQQFVEMISAQTGFQANSRVIQTSSQLLQQLINSTQ